MDCVPADILKIILTVNITDSITIGRIERVCKLWKNISRLRTRLTDIGSRYLPTNFDQLYPGVTHYDGSIENLRYFVPSSTCQMLSFVLTGSHHNIYLFFSIIRSFYAVKLEGKLGATFTVVKLGKRSVDNGRQITFRDCIIQTLRRNEQVIYVDLIGEKAKVRLKTYSLRNDQPADTLIIYFNPFRDNCRGVVKSLIEIAAYVKNVIIEASEGTIKAVQAQLKDLYDNVDEDSIEVIQGDVARLKKIKLVKCEEILSMSPDAFDNDDD